MTAQEIFEREGFIPVCSTEPWNLGPARTCHAGFAIQGSLLPEGTQLVLVREITREEFLRVCPPGKVPHPGAQYFYAAVAE
jgi:hypothetical protein